MTALLAWFMDTALGRALATAGAIVAVAFALWARGRSAGRAEAEAKKAEEYHDAQTRMDGADVGRGDAERDRDWLRDRGQR